MSKTDRSNDRPEQTFSASIAACAHALTGKQLDQVAEPTTDAGYAQ